MATLYGFYSCGAREIGVSLNIYAHPDGTEVLCTRVDASPGLVGWTDERFLGPVAKWVRLVSVGDFVSWTAPPQNWEGRP